MCAVAPIPATSGAGLFARTVIPTHRRTQRWMPAATGYVGAANGSEADRRHGANGPMSDEEEASSCVTIALGRGIDAILATLACLCPHCEDSRFGVWYEA